MASTCQTPVAESQPHATVGPQCLDKFGVAGLAGRQHDPQPSQPLRGGNWLGRTSRVFSDCFRLRRSRSELKNRAFGSHGRQDIRQIEAAEPARDGGCGARTASLLLLRHGSDREADPPALRGRRFLLERGGTLQHRPDAPGAGRQEGRQSRRRHAARVLHHHRHRRHRHGSPGHEGVAGLARGDRRFDRAHHARALLRRARRHRRLRQVAARDDDGHAAPQRAGGVHVRRLDPARQVQGPRRDRGRRVRGRRAALRRQHVGQGSAHPRVPCLPRRRCLRRTVHGQHHGDGVGGDRPGPAGLGRRAGALREPRRIRRGQRQGGDAPRLRRHPPSRYRHPQGLRECRDHRGGHRGIDQRRPAPAGHGARMRHRLRPDGGRRDLQAHTLHRRPQARRKVRRQGRSTTSAAFRR